MRRLRVLTWHVHGSYLYYLVQTPHEFFLPVRPDRADGYGGCIGSHRWPDHVHEVPVETVRDLELDCIIFQARRHYFEDQYTILSEAQRRLPRIYLEHDPPREHPTDTRHPVDDPSMLLVHVTHFNDLMWDSGRTPTRVIEHGVVIPEDVRYSGEIPRGLVVINGLHSRGRRLGADIFQSIRRQIPLDLIGIAADRMDGLGEVPHADLPAFASHYRFFFNPIRYTSLGLSVCEAMLVGMPIVGLATTEMVTVIEQGVSGYLFTDVSQLADSMRALLEDPGLARRMGSAAQRYARERFSRDWDETLRLVTGSSRKGSHAVAV